VDDNLSKIRPALILEDTIDDDIIICRITGQFHNSKYDVLVNDWKASGLLIPSEIRTHKIATVEKNLIHKMIGKLDNQSLKKVNQNLANLFK
jgi:mRNA interferase MazF